MGYSQLRYFFSIKTATANQSNCFSSALDVALDLANGVRYSILDLAFKAKLGRRTENSNQYIWRSNTNGETDLLSGFGVYGSYRRDSTL